MSVWLFTLDEPRAIAQQHAETGGRRLYWYTDPDMPQRAGSPLKQTDMADYLLERAERQRCFRSRQLCGTFDIAPVPDALSCHDVRAWPRL